MKRIGFAMALAMLLAPLVTTSPAHAQATRTWVSGVGDDANPCSRTAPCKTWAGAIAKTAPGGEIDALDPGGFGALTITKPITLDGGGGQVASVLVAGTNGIVVAAGSGDTVIIRNLRFDGLLCSTPAAASCTGSPGLTGISFLSGKVLNIENVSIFGFDTSGINVSLGASGAVNIVNSLIENIGTCVPASCTTGQGDGIFAKTTSGRLDVSITNTQVYAASNNGIEINSGSGSVALRAGINTCTVANNGAAGILTTGSTNALSTIDRTIVSSNGTGILSDIASALLANSTVSLNQTGVATAAGGKIFSYGNNNINGNASDNTTVLTTVGPS